MIERVDHLEVYARDIQETLDFYINTLGFQMWRHTHMVRDDGSDFNLACIRMGDMMVEIIQAPPEMLDQEVDQARMGMRMFALRVNNMAETIATLEGKGVEVFQAPRASQVFEGLRAEIVDPNGMRIELREWQRGDDFFNDGWEPSTPNVTKLN